MEVGRQDDVLAYKNSAHESGVQVGIEISRSGNGAHAWIFFSEPVASRLARQLGTFFLSRASASRHLIKLETYDRFFPNQDYLPKGGFGNLIALPLQKIPREKDNTVFVDDNLEPYKDQWKFLSEIRRLSIFDVTTLLQKFEQISESITDARFEDESLDRSEKALHSSLEKLTPKLYQKQIKALIDSQLSINLSGLPSPLIAAFKRTSTFANPKFFELQRLRFSTWKTPKYIFCGEIHSTQLILPRGVLDQCIDLTERVGGKLLLQDCRIVKKKFRISFKGNLRIEQKNAVSELIKYNTGVLVAPPGSGKTVIACSIIAKRKMSTLIVVHRSPLLEQWKERISEFLSIDREEIGIIKGKKKKSLGKVDIAMLQSLTKRIELESFFSQYSQIIIDECHHIAAISFESVVKKCPTRFVLGLTATPFRKDGHQAIIYMQCGPIRHEMQNRQSMLLKKKVIVRETNFRMPEDAGQQPPIHQVWAHLIIDQERIKLICCDVLKELEKGSISLIISERKDHLQTLAKYLSILIGSKDYRIFILDGDMGEKTRISVLNEIYSILDKGKKLCLFTTGSLFGEGFDLPALDTLFLVMPVSFKGKIIQYAGRIHRTYEGKKEVKIYDYVDQWSGLTLSMYRKRVSAYRKMGYKIEAPQTLMAGKKSTVK